MKNSYHEYSPRGYSKGTLGEIVDDSLLKDGKYTILFKDKNYSRTLHFSEFELLEVSNFYFKDKINFVIEGIELSMDVIDFIKFYKSLKNAKCIRYKDKSIKIRNKDFILSQIKKKIIELDLSAT